MASSLPAGVTIRATVTPQFAEILTQPALAFVAKLHRQFESRRQELLAKRAARQQEFDAGKLPDFLPDTKAIRDGDWTIAPQPPDLLDRRVEITGPTDRKMVINALNCGASTFMADFEDANCPTWESMIEGQCNLRDAVRRTITLEQGDKQYQLNEKIAVLIPRPRGWHLDEKHVLIDGRPVAGGIFDFALYFFHNANAALARGTGPYFYLPKMESHLEARLWNDIFNVAQDELGIQRGTIKATALIETVVAAFEMDEFLWELREHSAGLNIGRWDYIFSCIKTLRAHRDRVLPERGQVGMTQPFLKAYSTLLIRTCHRRGALAMGGMAAQIPITGDADANERAMDRVRADKQREVNAGHDGTWVAHPALIPIARAIFDAGMPQANQRDVLREDVQVTREDLLEQPLGTITCAGFESNVEVSVRYLAAWLDGQGCVPIHSLMEDAATAEIARAQLWQWLHYEGEHALHLDDGTSIDFTLFERVLHALSLKLGEQTQLPGGARIDQAIALLNELTRVETLADFLTLPAYELLA